MDPLGIINEGDECRWSHPALRYVIIFHALTPIERWFVPGDEAFKESVQLGSRHALLALVHDMVDLFEELGNALAGFGRDGDCRRIVRVFEPLLNIFHELAEC